MRDLVVRLAQCREIAALTRSAVVALRASFEVQNADLFGAADIAALALADAEAAVRVAAIASGEKNPAPGVSVVQSTVLRYEAAHALTWAKEHGMALALDKKAFDAIAKAGQVPFVTIEQVPSARIAVDLTAALNESIDGPLPAESAVATTEPETPV